MAKCHFGGQEEDFFGCTITTKGLAAQKQKNVKFVKEVKILRSQRALQRYVGYLKFYGNYIPRLAERLASFFQLLKPTYSKAKIVIIPDILKKSREET